MALTRRVRPRVCMDMAERLPEHIILEHILPTLDYTSWVRFAAVSRAWRRISADSSPPTLGIPSIEVSDNLPLHRWTIPPPSTFTSTHHPSSAASLGCPIGSFHHYLLLSVRTGTEKVYVVNAITGRSLRIPVPPYNAIKTAAFYTPDSSVQNGVASDWIAALAEFWCGVVHLYRADEGSRMLRLLPGFQVSDLIFHKGRLFCVSQSGEIVVFDVSGYSSPSDPLRPIVVIPARPILRGFLRDYNLVESCSSELLLVTRYYLAPTRMGGPFTLTVHRVDEEKKELVRLRDLGEQMLFVGKGCSRSVLYDSVRPRPSEFYTPNSIYFFFEHSLVDNDNNFARGLGKFSMDEDSSSNYAILHHQQPLSFSFLEPVWISKA